MSLKLKGKVILPTRAVIAAGLAAVSLISYLMISTALNQVHRQEAKQLARIMAMQTDGWIQERISNVVAASSNAAVSRVLQADPFDGDIEEINKYLRNIRDVYGVFDTVSLMDLNGRIIGHSDPSRIGVY